MAWTTELRRLIERAQGLLPIVLLGALALVTYWLVQNSPILGDAGSERPVSAKPDAYFHHFRIVGFDQQGQWLMQISGDRAQHRVHQDTYEIEQPRMLKRSHADAAPMRLSAERALASEEGRRMELFGQALIEQEADADARGQKKAVQELRSEYLLIDDRKQTVETQQPVTLVRGSDVFKADRMVASQQENRLQMDGRVRGTLMPRP